MKPIKIGSRPGIKRDGTKLEGENYVDGQWVRFQRGLPRKMGGFFGIASSVPEKIYGMNSFSADGLQYLHLGSANKFWQYRVNNTPGLAGTSDRTPGALVTDPNLLWQIDFLYDSVAAAMRIIAHGAPNLANIDSTTTAKIWYGTATAAAALVDTTAAQVSGGIVALGPYMMSYGSNGSIAWSAVNNPAGAGGQAFITPQKIVQGLPLRGTGGGPAGLFWSLDSLIRATFVGGTPVWAFDTISADTSILSSQGVIEYDGIYYWAGVDRFLMFNGVVNEIPNPFNQNWFFDNLNYTYRQKVFAVKVTRFGEIWWCYPRGMATECTHAVIYNIRENCWYDTQLPGSGRSAGVFAKVFDHPFMVDVDLTGTPGYTLWQHEIGTDSINGSSTNPVPSFFETNEISMLTIDQSADKSLRVGRVEPDFVQAGPMTLTVRGRSNARAPQVDSAPVSFPDTAAQPTQQTVKLKDVKRLMSFRFDTNTLGGDYQMGEPLAHVEPADGRIES